MGRALRFSSLHIHSKIVPCAHACRYCSMGRKTLAHVAPERLHALLARFLDGEKESGLPVSYVLNYTDNYDRRTLELLQDLATRFPREYQPLRRMTLGGQPLRSDAELHSWLEERRAFGCISAHGSLAGVGAVHDDWNGQKGNFDLILRTLRIAGELGMALGARLFVSKSTLPSLGALNGMLDTLPAHATNWRYAVPYFYAGWATRLEAERIDEATRDALPGWLLELLRGARSADGACRSEREWIKALDDAPESDTTTGLILNVTDANIDLLERQSCAEIISDLEARTRTAYDAIPSREELCERYGDRNGIKIYGLARCVEMKWLDQHLAAHPVAFERQLTHLQLGN